MSRLTSARALTLASLAVLATGLAGCGKTGELARPAPLFGQPRSPAKDAEILSHTDPSRPINTVDPRDEAIDPEPTRPLQGASPNPTASGSPTAQPSPYANPQ
jgi:hypothetical protein